jgi:putative transposase
MSERHACALVGLSRDTYRHVGHTGALNVEVRDQIVQTAHARRRWGYCMIHDFLRPQYPDEYSGRPKPVMLGVVTEDSDSP